MTQILRGFIWEPVGSLLCRGDSDLFSVFSGVARRRSRPPSSRKYLISYDRLRAMIAGFAAATVKTACAKEIGSSSIPAIGQTTSPPLRGFATGIVAIPVDARLTPAEVDFIVGDSGARWSCRAELIAAMQTALCRDRVLALDAVPPSLPTASTRCLNEDEPA